MPGVIAPLTLEGGGGIIAPLTTVTSGGDTTPPVLTLLGANPLQLIQGTAYVEPGYTSIDAVDGDVRDGVQIVGSIDGNQLGQQSLTYRSVDAAGNLATRVRVVNVVASASILVYPYARSIVWDDGKTPDLVIGDTFQHAVTLSSAGAAFDLSGATSIKAAIVSADHSAELAPAVEMASDSIGADWASGVIMLYMPGSDTAGIADYVDRETLARIEIQVEIGADKFSWFGAVRLIPGYIA